jgi:hypothetical protein
MISSIQEESDVAWANNFPPKDASSVEIEGKNYYKTPLHATVLKIVGQLSTKIFFGRKYSRDPAFIQDTTIYANGIVIQALLVNFFVPSSLKPLVRKYIMPYLPTATRVKKISKLIEADVTACIDVDESELEAKNAEGGSDFTILPLMVKYVQGHSDYVGASPSKVLDGVMGRTIGLLFAAVDTTTITFTQLVFDLVSHPKAQYAEPILEEAQSVLAKHGGTWSVTALGELKLLDSMIKESQRLHPIGVALGSRKVVAEGGHTFVPDEPGAKPLFFPQGSNISTPCSGVHGDSSIYPDANRFDGFRFAKDAMPTSQPSDKFMSFGHGKRCYLIGDGDGTKCEY